MLVHSLITKERVVRHEINKNHPRQESSHTGSAGSRPPWKVNSNSLRRCNSERSGPRPSCVKFMDHKKQGLSALSWSIVETSIDKYKPLAQEGTQGDICISIISPKTHGPSSPTIEIHRHLVAGMATQLRAKHKSPREHPFQEMRLASLLGGQSGLGVSKGGQGMTI